MPDENGTLTGKEQRTSIESYYSNEAQQSYILKSDAELKIKADTKGTFTYGSRSK